ncbi:MAG: hypothetical protein KDA42_05470 [Planctomycetales bacterium]|nr:hypothetical protein [Planctomycetales bacterium]
MRRKRTGASLVEVTVAAVICAALLSTVLKSAALVGRQRRETLRHTVAQQIVANQLEIETVRARRALPAEDETAIALEPSQAACLPAASMTKIVRRPEGDLATARIEIVLSWQTDAGNPASEQLTGWAFQPRRRGSE